LSNILIKDKNNDTLLFSEKIVAGIRKINLKKKDIGLGRIDIKDPKVRFITDTTGLMNLTWFLDKLKNPSDTVKKGSIKITIDQVNLNNANFALIKTGDTESSKKARINFSDLRLSSVNGVVRDLQIYNDTTRFTVNNLSLIEKSGFSITNMNSSVLISKNNILFGSVFLNTDSSILNIQKAALTSDSTFSNFINKVKLDIVFEKSLVSSSDLGYFVNIPGGLNELLSLSGRFMGTISELRGRGIEITYRERTSLDCDFDISGLPDIQGAFIYLGVNSFNTNATDIDKIIIPGKGRLKLPDMVYRLGNISFSGSFTGFITDFVTYGDLRTDQGNISTDISLRPEKTNSYRMKGLLSGIDLNIGEVTDNKLLGKLTINANIDGYASSLKKFAGKISGNIDSVEINQYNYRNIALNGSFTEKTWDGRIGMEDKNIKFDLTGMFNFSPELPEFDFTMNLAKADLYKLNIDKTDTTSVLSLLLTSNFKGNNIDNMDGEIKLLNSTIRKKDKTLEFNDFSVRTFTLNNKPALSLRTDIVNADIRGDYNFAGMKEMIKASLTSMMPSLFKSETKKENLRENNFDFEINFKNTDKINDFFKTGLLLAENSYIKGNVLPDSIYHIEGAFPSLSFRDLVFIDFNFNTDASKSEFHSDFRSSSFFLPGNTELKNFALSFNTNPDKFIFAVDWDNKSSELNKGNIIAKGSVEKSSGGKHKPVLMVDIDSTLIFVGDDKWKISGSSIVVDSNAIAVNRLDISSANRFYNITGKISEDPADTLNLQFKGIDISPLNYVINKNNTDTGKLKLNLRGRLNGEISVTNVYKNLLLESNILINDFSILGDEYGNISMNTAFDNSRKVVDINGGNNLGGKKMLDINGSYDPSGKKINIDVTTGHLSVKALNPLLRSFASNISGTTSGKVNLYGTPGNLYMTGAMMVENSHITINYLQTNYLLNDSIRFDRNGIKFNNVKFSDEEGKRGSVSGYVNHKNFRDYIADLTINMGTDLLVLNTQARDNPIFYGKVYASGVTKIKTAPNLLSFDIAAKTGRNTKFFIPLTNELSLTQNSFVSFFNPNEEVNNNNKPPETPKQLGLDVNIDLTVTADAVTEIIFDSKVGDKITGRGSGMLNINLNPKGDFRITGDYIIEGGDYLFTLKNIMNKKFDIEKGGRISFNGDIYNAEIDLRAKYKKFSTSLYPIIPEPQYRNEKVAVEPQLLLSGKLFNPTVNFEINLPDADEDKKTYLKNAISTEEELSRQFLFLLVMKSFYSDQGNAQGGTSTANAAGTSAMVVTTTEMLSNQLSNWISQISDNFDLGLNYKPGTGDKALNSDELNIAFQTQLLDNMVTINGNMDYSSSFGNAEQLTGVFDAEFRLTEKLRLKVFNRFNDQFAGKGPYTQGIGIFFKEDFKKLTDLFRRSTKASMKKEDEVKVEDPSKK
jgi:hypothetical protein